MPAFKLPTLRSLTAIANGNGQPTDFFLRLWNLDLVPRIETAVTDLQDVQAMLAAQQAVIIQQQAQIVEALELANIAIGLSSGNSGTETATIASLGTTFTPGPQVDLTGVVAGNLTIPGSGLTAVSGSDQNQTDVDGEVQLVEIVSAVETVIGGPWAFSSFKDFGLNTMYITNPTEINSLDLALTTTGDVSYRLDYRLSEPGFTLTNTQARLYARRTT